MSGERAMHLPLSHAYGGLQGLLPRPWTLQESLDRVVAPSRGSIYRTLLPLLALLLGISSAAHARGIPYGAVTDPALLRCDQQRWTPQAEKGGKVRVTTKVASDKGVQTVDPSALNAASTCYRSLATNSTDPAIRAEAAWALGDFKSANQWFGDALKQKPKNAALLTRWGELYVDTHQDQEALKLFKEALQADSNHAFAQVGAASVLVGEFANQANDYLKPVMEGEKVPPGAKLRGTLLAARVALENNELDKGAELLQEATDIATQAQLPQLEIYALKASLDLLNGKQKSEWTDKALAENSAFGDIYAVPAHFYEITRRTRAAVELYEKAVQIQPDLWSARVDLGSNLLRDNRITEAREQLEAAYKGDPYNPITVNLLRLLDSLKDFDTLVYAEPGSQAKNNQGGVVFRVNKKEAAVLAPYARKLAEESIAAYTKRYHFKLQEPVVIEIYPNHDDFAVRTAGMPGIGLLGVTFGYLFAMDSPTSRPVNEFHWGTTLWHEMAHVFTLSTTEHRIPRWFSEGLSVFEEWNSGPIKGVSIPGYALEAFRGGKALPVADLDRGFIRPEYPQQVQVSYMQAGLVCEFINKQYGFDKVLAMLEQFKQDNNTATAIEKVFKIPPKDFDAQFDAFVKARYAKLFADFDDWRKVRASIPTSEKRRDWNAVIEAAQKSLELLPEDVEDGSPYVALAEAYDETHKANDAGATLENYWKRGGHDPDALKALAKRLYNQNRKTDAVTVMQSINYVAPFDYGLHGELGDWLMDANRANDALTEYQVAMALDPPDRATAYYRLARAQEALQHRDEAKKNLLAALEVAPNFRPAQKLLLELSRGNP